MTPTEFISYYLFATAMGIAIGYLYGRTKAETEATRLRRWWFNREARNNGSRFRG